MSVIATCLVVLLILTFKPRYRRMEVDQNETGTELLERTKSNSYNSVAVLGFRNKGGEGVLITHV